MGGAVGEKSFKGNTAKKKKKAMERQKAHSDKSNVFLLLRFIWDRHGRGHFYWNTIVD